MRNLKIAIIGYGSMGKEIENAAREQKIEITDIFDINNQIELNKGYTFDIAIDFSQPDAVLNNIKILCELKKNIVLGTTGWEKHFNTIKQEVEKSRIGLIYGSNFSIGIQIFLKIINYTSHIMNKIEGYDIMLFESHHKRKKDSPSGTALKLAETIIKNINFKNKYSFEPVQGNYSKDTLYISSLRGGEIVGNHSVLLDSLQDSIELTHRAKNRKGFALGALYAAQWIYNKKGFYEINDIIDTL